MDRATFKKSNNYVRTKMQATALESDTKCTKSEGTTLTTLLSLTIKINYAA